MKLTVARKKPGQDSMAGDMLVDGVFVCHTLEDEPRAVKVKEETAIPAGTYQVTFRHEGGFNERYQKAYPQMHKGMLWIRSVPGFEYILIHQGNTDDDTAGCILVGLELVDQGGESLLKDSKGAYVKLYPQVAAALIRGEPVTIEVVDHPKNEKPTDD